MRYEPYYLNDVVVTLTTDQINAAIKHGMKMRQYSVAMNHRNHKGYEPDNIKATRVQALGAVCEAAVCVALDIPVVLESEVYNVPDLPNGIQIRLIGAQHYGLRVYPADDDSWNVVGVVIPPGCERKPYRIPGWFNVGQAKKRPEWSMAPHGRPPMFVVPQKCLKPLQTLGPYNVVSPTNPYAPRCECCEDWGSFGLHDRWFCREHFPGSLPGSEPHHRNDDGSTVDRQRDELDRVLEAESQPRQRYATTNRHQHYKPRRQNRADNVKRTDGPRLPGL